MGQLKTVEKSLKEVNEKITILNQGGSHMLPLVKQEVNDLESRVREIIQGHMDKIGDITDTLKEIVPEVDQLVKDMKNFKGFKQEVENTQDITVYNIVFFQENINNL